jgi:hypothetical protein
MIIEKILIRILASFSFSAPAPIIAQRNWFRIRPGPLQWIRRPIQQNLQLPHWQLSLSVQIDQPPAQTTMALFRSKYILSALPKMKLLQFRIIESIIQN